MMLRFLLFLLVASSLSAQVTLNHFWINQKTATGSIPIDIGGTALGTAAFTASTAYATAAQGTTADAAMPRGGGTFLGSILFTDNTLDIGASGATRPRRVYVGTEVVSPLFTGALTGTASGNVTSVAQSFTGGLISVGGSPITTSGTLALTIAGTSGGVPYFSSSSTWATSAALAANAIVIGGGAGVAPSTTATGTGVLTFLGTPSSANLAATVTDETGSGALVFATSPTFVTPALGIPSSGTVTNLTGTASININGTVGATTPASVAGTTGTWTGAQTNSTAGAASTPAMLMSGAPFTGGSGTTTHPLFYLNSGTAPTAWNTNGTVFGINLPSGYTGKVVDVHLNGGASIFSVDKFGGASFADTASGYSFNATSYLQAGNIYGGSNNSTLTLQDLVYSAAATTAVVIKPSCSGAGGTTAVALKIGATVNQTSTAAYTDLLINRTQTAAGSGTQRFIDCQIATASKFSVDNAGGVIIGSGSVLVAAFRATATLDFASTAAGADADLTITCTGAAVGDDVDLGIANASIVASGIFEAWVSAADTVSVRYHNGELLTTRDPASGVFGVTVWHR